MPDVPPPTAWGVLIRRARLAMRPPLSIPEAAKKAGLGKDNWGHVERGYQSLRGEHRPAHGQAAFVAHMAYTVGVAPDDLEETGRADAADVLRDIIERESGRLRYEDPALQRIWDDESLSEDERLGAIALIRACGGGGQAAAARRVAVTLPA